MRSTRLVHAIEELSRIGGEALDVAPLALRIEDVEGEARLARAGDPGDHGQGVQRHADVDALQVVLARTDDDDRGRVHDVCGSRAPRGNRRVYRRRAFAKGRARGAGAGRGAPPLAFRSLAWRGAR